MSTTRARRLRRDQTDAEKRLWRYLRNRQLGGFKFRRQVPVNRFVVDFLCEEAKLIIETDGGQHAGNSQDGDRTRILDATGYRVVRYWNNEVLANTEGVLESLMAELNRSTT